jgi:hypothetical protein
MGNANGPPQSPEPAIADMAHIGGSSSATACRAMAFSSGRPIETRSQVSKCGWARPMMMPRAASAAAASACGRPQSKNTKLACAALKRHPR